MKYTYTPQVFPTLIKMHCSPDREKYQPYSKTGRERNTELS